MPFVRSACLPSRVGSWCCAVIAALAIVGQSHAEDGERTFFADELAKTRRQFAVSAHLLAHAYLKDGELGKANLLYNALLDLERSQAGDELIADLAFSLVRHYCGLGDGGLKDAYGIYMSTYALTDSDTIGDMRHQMKVYLEQQGIQEAPDTIDMLLK